MKRTLTPAFCALALLTGTTLTASAGGGFSIVIPSRADVPIIINGIDASYATVEGDWGLARDVHMQPTIYGGRPVDPLRPVGRYFPSNGRLPGYGRLEIEPPADRPLPRRAEPFTQSWSAQSNSPGAVPVDPPAVIEAAPNGFVPHAPRQRRTF